MALLSNDPGNTGSKNYFFCYDAIRFLMFIGKVSFSHKECINLQKKQFTKRNVSVGEVLRYTLAELTILTLKGILVRMESGVEISILPSLVFFS